MFHKNYLNRKRTIIRFGLIPINIRQQENNKQENKRTKEQENRHNTTYYRNPFVQPRLLLLSPHLN